MVSRKESTAWMEGAIAVLKRLGARPAPCASLFAPDRYSLQTKHGEVKIDVANVFDYWGTSVRFMEPSRSPVELDKSAQFYWMRSTAIAMDEALEQFESELRSWML